jgi:hypothetical protein
MESIADVSLVRGVTESGFNGVANLADVPGINGGVIRVEHNVAA